MDNNLPAWLQKLADNQCDTDPVSDLPAWLAELDVADELVNGIPAWLAELRDEGEQDK